jgi:hypothetical protein
MARTWSLLGVVREGRMMVMLARVSQFGWAPVSRPMEPEVAEGLMHWLNRQEAAPWN